MNNLWPEPKSKFELAKMLQTNQIQMFQPIVAVTWELYFRLFDSDDDASTEEAEALILTLLWVIVLAKSQWGVGDRSRINIKSQNHHIVQLSASF